MKTFRKVMIVIILVIGTFVATKLIQNKNAMDQLLESATPVTYHVGDTWVGEIDNYCPSQKRDNVYTSATIFVDIYGVSIYGVHLLGSEEPVAQGEEITHTVFCDGEWILYAFGQVQSTDPYGSFLYLEYETPQQR